MNFRELIKINPVRLCLFVIITVLTPITLIGNTALVQLETTIVLSRNLRNFIIISAISLVVAVIIIKLRKFRDRTIVVSS